ncbi:hypothetical protein B0A49_12353 [Cryomyces minteri]|uniref:Uncharacterized protein n=1 Tax=Cryomyces minteri TaxID=331657 RepID=A0A4U0VVB3_9PEZI|nr:hypothetical protein B0A49_12353 [Cryomyces minteri]
MRAATITAILAFSAGTLAAGPAYSYTKRQSESDQSIAITGWDSSVNGVNDFLNSDKDEGKPADFAGLEPGFLATLEATPSLGSKGAEAAAALEKAFPAIPQALADLISGGQSVQQAQDAINNIRCPTVLSNISTLWIEAAAAAGADTPGAALGSILCPLNNEITGDAYTAAK